MLVQGQKDNHVWMIYNEPCLNPELYNLLLQFKVYPMAITEV